MGASQTHAVREGLEMHALGWIDPSSPTSAWDAAQVRRLARRLGYALHWADPSVQAARTSGRHVLEDHN
ncbi:hypothetical protein DXT66_21875 [Nocardia farcinica]|nr:hypothetical protein DXT66_21875 [Nocardia farcinica]